MSAADDDHYGHDDDDDNDHDDDCLHHNALSVTASLEVLDYPACIAHCIVTPRHALSM